MGRERGGETGGGEAADRLESKAGSSSPGLAGLGPYPCKEGTMKQMVGLRDA